MCYARPIMRNPVPVAFLVVTGLAGCALFARRQPWAALVDTSSLHLDRPYLPAFLASALGAMWCYYGFEACGDVAEETPDAGRLIPKSMRLTIYVGGVAALWVCLGFVLAVPDVGAVLAGKDKDPVVTVLQGAMGQSGLRIVILIVSVSFVSALLSLQAAASRLLWPDSGMAQGRASHIE